MWRLAERRLCSGIITPARTIGLPREDNSKTRQIASGEPPALVEPRMAAEFDGGRKRP
jgi:hypothetical protein